MTQPIRIIPRLEFKGPNLIKGLEFEGNRSLGLLKDFAKIYSNYNFDEIIFYDIVASLYNQSFNFDSLNNISNLFNIPINLCGGFRKVRDIEYALKNGADKISLNTSLFNDKNLLKNLVKRFGSSTIISNIEYYKTDKKYILMTEFGRSPVNYDLIEWIKYLCESGIGEIHLLNIKSDGYGNGIDYETIDIVSRNSNVPLVYGGGIGNEKHVLELCKKTNVSGISIASMFHYNYSKPNNKPYSNFKYKHLRNGDDIDTGNIDFINTGYGGLKDIFVKKQSVTSLKKYLKKNNCNIRI